MTETALPRRSERPKKGCLRPPSAYICVTTKTSATARTAYAGIRACGASQHRTGEATKAKDGIIRKIDRS